jgi:hypothetical protein
MSTQALFDLLPALYRLRDAQLAQVLTLLTPAESAQLQSLQTQTTALSTDQQQQLDALTAKAARGPLQSLLMLIDEQFALMANDLNQRYDDLFIETCAPWVIPYIGDLIGYQLVNGVAPAVASPRAEVANTVAFRRRKGTVLVLEQLARDVTGWGAHAVEFFQKLATTQYLKHVRLDNHYAPDLRRWQPRAYMGSAFDRTAHQVDVRAVSIGLGRYNVQNVGVFLWSLNAYGATAVPATAVDGGGQLFRINPLGADMALFNNPVSQGVTVTAAAQPVNVPNRLSRALLSQDLQAGAAAVYYGVGNSVSLALNGTVLNPYQIQVCSLSGPDGHWSNLPAATSPYVACLDPELGRVALVAALASAPAAGSTTSLLQSSYYYGFGADMGGGGYSRSDSFAVPALGEAAGSDEFAIFPFPDTATPPRYTTLQAAVSFALSQVAVQAQVAIEIVDDGVYPLPAAPALQIDIPTGATLELRAAQGCRPTVLLGGEMTLTGGALSKLYLNGLLIAYAPASSGATLPVALLHAPATGNQLGTLSIAHCTVVPGCGLTSSGPPQAAYAGVPSLLVESAELQIALQNSIMGSLWVSVEAATAASDCIIDATGLTAAAYAGSDGSSGGGALTLQGCTVIGKIHAALFTLVSNSIVLAELAVLDKWSAALWSDRQQQGCVRFSYMPRLSIVPQQFECLVQSAAEPQPLFYSLQYGDPGYCKLLPSTDDVIRRGADDDGEMGAFHFVLAPLREDDLRARLNEYLPAGLEFGIFYQT